MKSNRGSILKTQPLVVTALAAGHSQTALAAPEVTETDFYDTKYFYYNNKNIFIKKNPSLYHFM